jgi:CHAT domain-containing protein
LTARLVVASACQTGFVDTSLPDEVISLPTGLLQAGAAGVIASPWRVPDAATMILILAVFRRWQTEGAEPAEALRSAQQWLRTATSGQILRELASDRWPPADVRAAVTRLLAFRNQTGSLSPTRSHGRASPTSVSDEADLDHAAALVRHRRGQCRRPPRPAALSARSSNCAPGRAPSTPFEHVAGQVDARFEWA